MPERRPTRTELQRRLTDAYLDQQFVCIHCNYCRGPIRYYYPEDLIALLGDVPLQSLPRYMRCEKCGGKEYLTVAPRSFVSSERQNVRIRKLVRVKTKKVPVWKDE